MDELIKDFLQESTENLDHLDQDFVKLEGEPENLELLKSIFRTIHTIKGTCGFLGFAKLEALTHAGGNLLSLLRDGELRLTEASADVLLEMVDAVRQYLREIEQSGEEGRTDTSDLIARLKKLQERGTVESRETEPAAIQVVAPPPILSPMPPVADHEETASLAENTDTAPQAATIITPASKAPVAKQKKMKQELMPKRLGGALVQKANLKPADVLRALEMQQAGDSRRLGGILVELGLVTPQQIEEIVRQTKQDESKETAIRVDVGRFKLDEGNGTRSGRQTDRGKAGKRAERTEEYEAELVNRY